MSGRCYRCGNDPCTCGYEDARKVLVARLREIGAEDSRNGYTALANDVAAGVGVHIDSWIAMDLIADAARLIRNPADRLAGMMGCEFTTPTPARLQEQEA